MEKYDKEYRKVWKVINFTKDELIVLKDILKKPVQSQLAVLGLVIIGRTINKVSDLANTLLVCFDAGAKKILLPMVNAADIPMVSPELFAKFQIMFYSNTEDTAFKDLGFNKINGKIYTN